MHALDRPSPLTTLGGDAQGGTYILRINITQSLNLRFGRFKGGKCIALPAGDYLYLGSALSQRGATSLGRRLVRHATRSGQQAPHQIRASLIEACQIAHLGTGDLRPKQGKTLFWNIDHLLDQPTVHLIHIFAIRNLQRLEKLLGQWLLQDPAIQILEKGLGANDIPGNTHILRVVADEIWWDNLPARLAKFAKSAIEPDN